MSIIDTLITDRTQADVDILNQLYAKPLDDWTDEEVYFYQYGTSEALEATDGELYDSDNELIVVGDGVVRGAYNADDLNRVGRAVRYLAEKLWRTSAVSIDVSARQDWHITSIPTAGAMSTYLNDIKTIRNTIGAYSSTPAVPSSASKLTYTSANNIEKILRDANERLDRTVEGWRYAGEIYAGEV